MASLAEIARHARVAKSTVSLVLNNRPNVSPEMREKILRVVAELDPALAYGRGSSRRAVNILLIHPLSMSSHQVFRELLQGVKSAVVEDARGNLTMAVHDPPLKPDHTTSALIHDPALKPDGVIVMAASENDPIIEEIRRAGLPCVLLARQHGPKGTSVVGMDNTAGAREAVDYLLTRGHRDIAFVGGSLTFDYTELRLQGYSERMSREGLPQRVYLGEGRDAVETMIRDSEGIGRLPSALFFVNDEHALHGIGRLSELGYRVPRDLSAIGFDDSDNATRCDPPLTTVRVPRFLIGRLAGRTILDHVQTPEMVRTTILLRTGLTVRDSVRDHVQNLSP
jgi:DNA-binding LacI/PurR family transcriptional regulator